MLNVQKFDLRIVWNAIFYLAKTGCQWRMLPKGHVRMKRGQKMEPSVGIMDSQSVKGGFSMGKQVFRAEKTLVSQWEN